MGDVERAKELFFKAVGALERREFASAERSLSEALTHAPRSVPALNNLAVAQYEQGKIAEAAATAQRAVAIDPANLDALFMLSACQTAQERYEDTIASCRTIIGIDPSLAEAHCNLGHALKQTGQYEKAIESFDRAIGLDPRMADAFLNRGNALHSLKRHAEALASYDKALALKHDLAGAWLGRGNVFAELKRYDEAFAAYDKAISITPGLAEAWLGRGNACIDLKRFDDAAVAYDKALTAAPGLDKAWLGRGNAFAFLKRFDDALAAYDKTLSLDPESEDAWLGRGNVFTELKRDDEALAAYDKALAMKPELAEAWLGRGNVFSQRKRFDDALVAYDKALSLKPDLTSAWVGRGNVLFNLNRDSEALACFEKALALTPDLPEAQLNKALLKLSLGDFEDGWKLYEWRWRTDNFTSPARRFTQPPWLNDADITGKTILIHAEQGLGDTIQFSRYLHLLKDKKCRIIFEVPEPLAPLFRSPDWPYEVFAQGQTLPPFDVQCPLVSLPLAFDTRAETIPSPAPYIRPRDDKKAAWAEKIGAASGKPRVGLAWSGNPRFAGGHDIARPVPLSMLGTIVSDNFAWYRLQTDLRASDRPALDALTAMRDFSGSFHDFADTAALIAQLDLVISIDTAVAHLAGAMGRPVWILLPFHPDFRWLRERTDSPWYPTARLYRQSRMGDWTDVLARVAADLGQIDARRPR